VVTLTGRGSQWIGRTPEMAQAVSESSPATSSDVGLCAAQTPESRATKTAAYEFTRGSGIALRFGEDDLPWRD
jgi:hypothetical protein